MKVILTTDVDKIGKTGEMKTVADGFATNYLIPQKLAVPASGGAYRAYQHDRSRHLFVHACPGL